MGWQGTPALYLLDYDGTATTNSVELLWQTITATFDPSLATQPMVDLMKLAGAFSRNTQLAIVREVLGPFQESALLQVAGAFQRTSAQQVEFRPGLEAFLRLHGERVQLLTEAVVALRLPTERSVPVLRARADLGKADPETYLSIASGQGLAPEQVCLIDDCYFALRAAKRAGLQTILVRDEPSRFVDTVGRGVDRVVADFYSLLENTDAATASAATSVA
jgi:HAD superfamily hydrolase (TIGR01509 family)